MKIIIATLGLSFLLAGCASSTPPDDYRAGDFVVLYKTLNGEDDYLPRAAAMCSSKPYRMSSYPSYIKPSSGAYYDASVFACTPTAALKYGSAEAKADSFEWSGRAHKGNI
ncbi:hypothetical protein [Atlantibacter subterraneus]|uniref:hypothetical protein n=1 Tax=Atlantibacter subterraneus TaxID=255519 RepID=UPI000F66EE2B|nr:hypothetical protein [Atlantibacter subterranea]